MGLSMRTPQTTRRHLFATTLLAGVTALAAPALAQTGSNGSPGTQTTGIPTPASAGAEKSRDPQSATTSTSGASSDSTSTGSNTTNEVVVTGSFLRRKLADSDAPITAITADDLDKRGITTIQQAVQQVSANGSGALPNSFTANGAFAAGASAVSLHGLTSNSTLTLFDGLRQTFYPLADDGVRNFVDLNTIPDIIVDQVQVLTSGASAIYGADAVAGVVNIITKKTYEGLTVRAEDGIAQHGGAGEVNFQALAGKGNLARDGYNVYVGIEYEHDDALLNRDRGYPYNTANLSNQTTLSNGLGAQAAGTLTGRTNGVQNGLQFDNTFVGVGADIVGVVRPFNAANTAAVGNYQLLNPTAGCRGLTPITIQPSQATVSGFSAPVTLCQQDLVHDYSVIAPDDKRFSISGRFTKNLPGNAQAYVEVNYYQNDVNFNGAPSSIRATTTPAATGQTVTTTSLALPVYVCPQGVGCNATNGVLNPNNPFAALGEVARIFYRFGDIPVHEEEFNQTYRMEGGVKGDFSLYGDWHYNVEATGSQTDLRVTQDGRLYYPGLINAVNTGSYNFVDPSQNTAAVRNSISPPSNQYSTSKLYQIQGNLSRSLLDLPGGPLQVDVIGSARYEAIYNPSANDDSQGPANRYFTINPFGVIAHRDTEAAALDFDAPILKQIDLDASVRYDRYSTGQDAVSPKFGGKIRPFADWMPMLDKFEVRSTFSRGFRIPSFAETNSIPTTGFVTYSAPLAFQAAHGNDTYGQGYSLGETSLASPNLKPEHADTFTGGIVLDPIRSISLSLDFYRIKKTNVIAALDFAPAINAYYSGQPIPAGYTVTPDVADPNYPNAPLRLAFVGAGYANLNEQTTSGYDIAAQGHFNLPYNVKYTTSFDGTYVLRFNQTFPDGSVQHYAGTIGPYNTTSASGTPKFRANWTNTLAYGPATVSVTAYYTDGYQEEAEDIGGTAGDCVDSSINTGVPTTYRDGSTPVSCKVKPFWDIDLHTTYNVTKNLQAYVDVSNLFDRNAPLDPTTYGGYQYNPAWANDGIVGRYFKVGLKAVY